jgi:hypothetical protein
MTACNHGDKCGTLVSVLPTSSVKKLTAVRSNLASVSETFDVFASLAKQVLSYKIVVMLASREKNATREPGRGPQLDLDMLLHHLLARTAKKLKCLNSNSSSILIAPPLALPKEILFPMN